MELVQKSAGVLLVASAAALLVKKSNPELGFLISVGTVCALLLAVLPGVEGIRTLRDTLEGSFGVRAELLLPVLKCAAISVCARLCADLCREAGLVAAATGAELTGAICAMGAALPLVRAMLETVGGMI